MIVIPASLRSDFIHMPGMTIHIALESTIHIVGIRNRRLIGPCLTWPGLINPRRGRSSDCSGLMAPTYGISSSFPVVFRASKSRCARCASASG
jgi:hypothetical protein